MTPRSRKLSTGVSKSAKGAAANRPRPAKKSAVAAKVRRTPKKKAPVAKVPRTPKKKTPAAKAPRTARKKARVAKAPRAPKKKTPAAKARRTPKKKAPAAKARRAAKPAVAAPYTLEELVMQALVMELDAAQRYTELADAMETHNNLEVGALFRKMAGIEGRHAEQIMDGMGWTAIPGPHLGVVFWEGFETPETTPGDAVHYLMQPYHALELALANEKRAERFFGELARAATSAPVRKAARELQAEEREHVELILAWMEKVPKPDAEWAHDPDPPVYTD